MTKLVAKPTKLICVNTTRNIDLPGTLRTIERHKPVVKYIIAMCPKREKHVFFAINIFTILSQEATEYIMAPPVMSMAGALFHFLEVLKKCGMIFS